MLKSLTIYFMDNTPVIIDKSKITKEVMWEMIQLMPAKDATTFRKQFCDLGVTGMLITLWLQE